LVLFVHEVHTVVGREADEFDALYRDEWIPALAQQSGVRVLWFLHQAHGTGPAYIAVSILGVDSLDSLGDLDSRVRTGDLHGLSAATDALRHGHVAKVLTPTAFSALQEIDLATVPASRAQLAGSDPVLFMEDTAWPHRGRFDDYLAKAEAIYVPTLERSARTNRNIIELVGAFTSMFGSGRHREVVLWQRVLNPEALLGLLSREVPEEHRAPGTWMHEALDVRDRWESRLLRTAAWSPLA
jgi:hypothetical protein